MMDRCEQMKENLVNSMMPHKPLDISVLKRFKSTTDCLAIKEPIEEIDGGMTLKIRNYSMKTKIKSIYKSLSLVI